MLLDKDIKKISEIIKTMETAKSICSSVKFVDIAIDLHKSINDLRTIREQYS